MARSSFSLALAAAVVLAGLGLGLGAVPTAHAAATLVATSGSASTDDVMALDVPRPSAAAAGDVLFAQVVLKRDAVASAPAGWSRMHPDLENTKGNEVRMAVFYRQVTSAEPATYTFSSSVASVMAVGMMAFDGLDSSIKDMAFASVVDDANPVQAAGVDSAAPGLVLFFAGVERGASCTAAGGATLAYGSYVSGTGKASNQQAGACSGFRVVSDAGPVAGASFTLSKKDSAVLFTLAVTLPSLSWAEVAASGLEGGPVGADVTMSSAISRPVSVPFVVSAGSATLGTSCVADVDARAVTESPLTIAANALSASITVEACPDAAGEWDETFTVTLGTPTDAYLAGPAAATFTILDDDPRFLVGPDPVALEGDPTPATRWGGWAAVPGALGPVWATNYLAITNNGPEPDLAVTINFAESFVGASGDQVPIDGNLRFACREGTAGQRPVDLGEFLLGDPSPTGSVTASFTALGNVLYCTYALHGVPDLVSAEAYEASFVVV